MKGGIGQVLKTNKKSFFSNLFSEREKNKNGNSDYQNNGMIDLRKISEHEENEKKQNVLKILFKNRKHNEKYSSDEDRSVVDVEAEKISERFNTAHTVLWIVLLLFVVIFCVFFSEGITTGNMQHMFRNMFVRSETSEGASSYYFSINENAVFGGFAEVPVVAGSDRIVIFSPDGSHEYSAESKYSLPAMITSDKYVLIYDKSGKSYGIYDEFGLCHFESTGGKIYGGMIAYDGTYALARKGSEYMTEITVYNFNFEVMTAIKKNNAYASMDIKNNGSEIMLVTYSVLPDGNVESELMLLKNGEKSPRVLLTLENGTPIECKYLEGDRIAILFDKAFCIFDKDGNMLSSCALNINDIYIYNISDEGRLLLAERIYKSSSTFRVEMIKLNDVGMKKIHYTLNDTPVGLNMYGDYAYIITEHKVIRLDKEDFDNEDVFVSDRKLYSLIFVSGDEFVCMADSALKIVWKEIS